MELVQCVCTVPRTQNDGSAHAFDGEIVCSRGSVFSHEHAPVFGIACVWRSKCKGRCVWRLSEVFCGLFVSLCHVSGCQFTFLIVFNRISSQSKCHRSELQICVLYFSRIVLLFRLHLCLLAGSSHQAGHSQSLRVLWVLLGAARWARSAIR